PTGLTNVCALPALCVTVGGRSTCRAAGYTESAVLPDFIDACRSGFHVPDFFTSRESGIASVAINLPFTFQIWGSDYTRVTPSVNGVLYFGSLPGAGAETLAPGHGYLPTNLAGAAAAPFWDDLYLGDAPDSDVCFALVGSSPGRRFAVQWQHA